MSIKKKPKKLSQKKSVRIIFDRDFYILEGIIKTDKYKRLEHLIKEELAKIGFPLPTDGFKTAKEYMFWYDKLKEKGLDPKNFLRKIAIAFGIDIDNPVFYIGLRRKLFFNYGKSQTKPLIRLKEDTDGLWLKITPWMKKEDIITSWNTEIKPYQAKLAEYRGKEKEWETFERDFDIYNLYLKAKDNLKRGIYQSLKAKKKAREGISLQFKDKVSKSIYINMTYYPEFENIAKRYNCDNLDDNLRSIISRCKQIFGKLNLL